MFFMTKECKPEPLKQSVEPRGFRLPLYLRSLPARLMTPCTIFIHIVAVIGVFFTSLPVFIKAVLLILIIAVCAISTRRAVTQSGMQLVLNARDDWFVIEANGQSRAVQPVSGLILHANLVLMTVRDDNGQQLPFVFTLWNTDADSLRRLRVRLKATSH